MTTKWTVQESSEAEQVLCRLHKIKLWQSENNRTLTLLNEYMMYLVPLVEFRKMCRHKCSVVCYCNRDLSEFMSALLFTPFLKSVHISLCLLLHGTDLQTPQLLLWTHALSPANLLTNHFELPFLFLAQISQIVLLFLCPVRFSSFLSLNRLKSAFCSVLPLVMLQSVFVIR
jgi:hypothetical protein